VNEIEPGVGCPSTTPRKDLSVRVDPHRVPGLQPCALQASRVSMRVRGDLATDWATREGCTGRIGSL